MRDAGTPKLKLLQKYFMFINWQFYYLNFFLSGDLKFSLDVFHQTNLMNENMSYFLKTGPNKNILNFVVYKLSLYLIQLWRDNI